MHWQGLTELTPRSYTPLAVLPQRDRLVLALPRALGIAPFP